MKLSPARSTQGTLLRHATALIFLAGMAALLFGSMQDESPTTDEGVHLTRGIAYYWGQGASLSYAHPPLGNALAALPIVLREPAEDLTKVTGYDAGQVDLVARALFEKNYEQRRQWFFDARASMACITLALGVYVYWLASTLFGGAVGLAALFFYAFHPTLIAHGRLMTTDMPVTAAMIVSLGELVLFLSGRARWHGVLAVVMAAIALSTKYTALALLPILGVLVFVCAWLGLGRYAGRTRRRALGSALLLGVFLAATSLFTINAAYRFERTGMRVDSILELPEPINQVTRGYKGKLLERRSILRVLPGWLRLPLPFTYVYGMASISVHDRGGHYSAFFGKPQRRGHPAYFPVMVAVKTPLLLLGGLFAALLVFVQRKGRVSLAATSLGWFATALLLLATRGSINIGVRHVLPLLPVTCILGALGVVHAYRSASRSELRTRLAVCLAAAHLYGLAWCYPDYISDFNALVGGRRGGEQISVVGEEWGQDMVRFGTELQERGVRRVQYNVDTFISGLELKRFGVTAVKLICTKDSKPRGWVAVAARERVRDEKGCYAWEKTHQPVFEVNNHIRVYSLSR